MGIFVQIADMSNPVVELKNASIYQHETLVLSDVNFSINKGDFIYIIGRTGSGKSSLLKTLYGDLPLRDGMGQVAGFDLRTLTLKQIPFLRRKLGIIFQDFQLLTDRSVEANRSLPCGLPAGKILSRSSKRSMTCCGW